MLDEVDNRLLNWATGVVGDVEVVLGPPVDDPAKDVISLHLLDLTRRPAGQRADQSVWPFQLRFLVTASGRNPIDAHRSLGVLLAAAIEMPEFEIEGTPPPLELWHALRAKPQPAFIVCLPWLHQKDLKRAPSVTRQLQVEHGPLGSVRGIVLGPGDVPVMFARVEIMALGRSVLTDAAGRFRFTGIPQGIDLQLRVSAKAVVSESSTSDAVDHDGNLVLRLSI